MSRQTTAVLEGHARGVATSIRRLAITGARCSLAGTEAILRLRALASNDDFDAYWRYHLAQEHRRVHQSRYAHNTVPRTA